MKICENMIKHDENLASRVKKRSFSRHLLGPKAARELRRGVQWLRDLKELRHTANASQLADLAMQLAQRTRSKTSEGGSSDDLRGVRGFLMAFRWLFSR